MLQADRGDLQAFRLRSDSSQSVDSAPRENPAHTPVFGERRSVGCPPPTSLVETSEPSRRPTGRGLEARDLWKNSASHQSLGPSRGASDSLGDTRSEADRVDAAPAAERGGARFLRGPDGSLTPAMSYESASVVSPVDTASAEAVLGQLADERTQRTSVEEEEDTSRSLLCDTIVARLESLLDEEGTNARRQLVSLTVLSVTSNDSDNSQRNGQSDGNGQDSDAKHAFSPPASESPFPSLPGDSPGSLPAARDGASEGPGSDRARPAAADPAQRSDSPGGSEGFRLGSQSSAGGRGAAAPRTPRDQPGASDRRESPFCLQSDPSDGQESSFCIRSESAASEEKPQPADTIVPDTTGENLVLRAFEDDWEATRKAVEESAWEDGNRLFMQVQITCADFTEDDKREDLLCEESMARSRVVLLSMWKRDALQQEQDDKAEDAAAASGSIAASVEKHAVDPVAAPACSDAAPASRDSRTSDTPADSSTNLPSPAERSNHAADSIENQNADTLVQPAPPVSSTERPSDPPAGSPAGQSPVGRPGLAASVGKHNGVALAVPASPAGSSEPMASRDSRTSDPPAGSPASQATVEVVHHAADADDSSDKGARPGDHPPTGRINDATVSVGRHAVGSSPNIDSPASSISPARDAASTPLAAGDSPPMQRQAERSPAKTAQAVDTLQTPTATRTPTAARSDGLATGVPAGAVRTGAAADSTEKRAETSAASMPPGAFVPSDPRPGEAPDAPEKRIVGSSPDIGPPASSDSPARDAASTAGDSPSMQQQAVLSPAGTTQAVPNMLKQTPAATCTAAGSTEKRAEMPAAPAPPRAFIPSDSRPIESPDAPENRAVGSELPNSSSGSGRGASGGGRDRRRVGAALAVSALAAPCVPSFPSPSRVIFSESASMATAAVATVAVAAHACGQPPRPYHHRADTSPTAWRGAAWSPANPARSRTDEAALPPPAAALACRDGSAASPPPSSVGCGGPGVHPALAGPGRPRPGGTGGYQVIRLDRRNAGEPPGDCDRAKRSPNASSTSPCGLTMTSACSSRCSVLDEARDHHAHSIRGFSSSSLASGPVDAVHGDTHPAGDAKPGSSRAVHWSSDVAGTRRARGEVRRAAARAVQSAWRRSSAAAELQRRVAGRAAARLVGEERQLHAHAALLLQAWARGWLARRRARAAAARYTDTQRTDAPSAQAAWAIEREARYMDTQRMHASSAQAVWILEQEARRNDTQRTHVSSAQAAWAVDRYNDTQRTHASSAQAAWPLEQEARRREYQRSYNDTQRTHASSGNNTQRTHVSSAQAAWALEQEARRLRAERRSLQETVLYLRMENQLESGRSDALHGDLVRAKTRLALIDREVSRTRPRSPYASYGSHDGLSSVADPHADPLDRATTAAVARSLDDRRAAAGNREGEHRYYNYPNDRVDSAEYLAVGSSVADPHADPYDRASTAAVARSLDRRAAAGNREGEHRYYYPNGRVDGAGFPPAEYLAAGSGARSGGRACRADPNLGFEEHPGAGVHPSQSERPEAPRALPMEQAASPPESCRRGPWRAGSAAASSGAAAQTDLDHALERAASATPYRMPPPVRDPSDPPSPGPARICSSDGPGCPTDDERAETTPSPSSDSLAVAPSVKPDEDRCASSTSVPSPDPSYRLAVAVRDNAPACDREVAPAASSGSHRQKRNLGFVCELVPQGVDDRFDVVHRRTVSERKRGSLEREEASWVQGGHRALRLERKRREISRDREALRREAEAVEGEMRGPERLYATGDWGNENTALLLRALVHDGDRRDHELRAALASIQQTHKHLASAFYSHHPQPVLVSTRRTAASSSLASTPPDRKPSRSCLHPYQTPVSTSARTSPAAAKPRAKSKLQLSARQAAEAILYPDDPRHRPRHAWS
ncbi:hypothetical protein DIPPA_23625 [Diplonema papillatum]|nr:hypothetical protein DIPPA_23625 [Diplonema papillatum]